MTKIDPGHYRIAPGVEVYRSGFTWTAVIGSRVVRGCTTRKQAVAICHETVARNNTKGS